MSCVFVDVPLGEEKLKMGIHTRERILVIEAKQQAKNPEEDDLCQINPIYWVGFPPTMFLQNSTEEPCW